MKLTDHAVAALVLPTGKNEDFKWDDDLPSFGVRLRGKTKRWVVQYRVGFQQRRESLGDVRKIKLEAARKIARQRFAQVELGADPAADRARARADSAAVKLQLGVVADRYLSVKRDLLRPATYKAAARYFEIHWKDLRDMPIGTLRRSDVAATLQEITAAHGRVSAARARANLSALLGWAMREGLCETNVVIATNDPARGIPARERVLEDSEIGKIWKACLDDNFGRIIKLLILSGCRREEIGGLKWSEIDLDTGVLSIAGTRIKNRKNLTLTLPALAIDLLRSVHHQGQEFVFGKRGSAGFNAWSYSTIALNNRIAAATGHPLPHWTLHDLRRTMRTGMGRLSIPPHIAELVIGHSKGGIEAVYDKHKYGPEIQMALARWAEHVIAIVEERRTKVVPLRA